MSQFLNLKEATKFTGKSESTLKRMIREITADPQHADRPMIEPDHEELEAKRAAGEPYVWKIEQTLLEKRYPRDEATPKQGSNAADDSQVRPESHVALAEVLREQLQSKDRQIQTLEKQLDRKDEQIANQHERMREQNVLMKDLQQRLAIAPPVKSDVYVEADPEEGSPEPKETQPQKRSIWQREFRLFSRK